ncbi:MAG: M42 family metallopeptidase, partial [Candidatus Rifleibacteriota bacterium]
MNNLELIEKLTNLHGTSGYEDEIIRFISQNYPQLTPERDSINNLYLKFDSNKSKKPVVALDCHSDEVGFMVEHINSNGTISFLPLGRWHAANIPAHAVIIKNSRGEYVKGVIASKPPHFMSEKERNSLPLLEDMVIDIGTGSYEETANTFSIETGNPITPDVSFSYNEKIGIMRGKAFDNRLGCAAVLSSLSSLTKQNLEVAPVGLICSQEEVGTRGAQVAANKAKPDFTLVFEGSPADDTFKNKSDAHGILGHGIQFRVMDAGMITNHRVHKFACEIAAKNNIPFQVIARNNGHTNGSRYHVTQNGIPSLVVGIPSRYIHTHYSYA